MRTQLFLVTAALAAAIPAQAWTQQTLLLNPPGQRRLGAAAFEAAGSRLIFHGGVTQTPAAIVPETWRFNATWQQLTPAGGTVGRWGHQLVTNTITGRLFTFGGRSPTISGFANDTIEWNGSAWVNVPSPTAPSPRYLYGMSFDSRRGVVVLFGGRTASTTLDETWEFNGTSWAPVTLTTTPPARAEMAMVFDRALGATVLFGGYDLDTDTVYGDTWIYDGVDWRLTPTDPALSPGPRYRTAAVYDTTRSRTVLYGGYTGTLVKHETYEFNGEKWQLTVPEAGPAPQAATETLHGYDPVRKKLVLFGGFGTTFSNQTWEYGYPATVNPGAFVQFGTACDTGPVPHEVTSSVPTLGQNWQLGYANLPTAANTALLVVLGLSNQTWTGIPLPFDLAPLGLSGCSLLVSADIINAVLPLAGFAQHSLAIPNTASLENAVIYTQGVVLQIGGPGLGFVGTTRGGYAIIGRP